MNEAVPAVASQISEPTKLSEYSAVASFIIVVWDAFITIDAEVTYIWPKPRGAYIKWLYLFEKYFTLALQIGIFFSQLSFANNTVPILSCHVYRGIQVTGIHLLLVLFDIVLFLRIYALHSRNTFAMVAGILAVLVEFVTAIVGNVLVLPRIVYDSACVMASVSEFLTVIIAGMLVSQTTLLWLAYRKKEMVVRAERGRSSIASSTIRDGVVAFVCISGLCLALLVTNIVSSSVMNMVVFWFPPCVSFATCRLIMNLQRAPQSEPTQELTTEIWRPEYELESRSCVS